MAEVLMDRLIKGRTDRRCLSAGISAFDGQPASDLAVEVMGEIGVSLRHHQSLSLRAGLVDQADYLFTMTSQQTELVTALYPGAAGKTWCLRQFDDLAPGESRDISDPIGLPREVYRQTRDTIRRALPLVLEFIDRPAAPPAPRSAAAGAATGAGST
ncbi:hypothetical protein HQ590_03310, partial [bacterium]|nr:hypothetical protein [bacterium]